MLKMRNKPARTAVKLLLYTLGFVLLLLVVLSAYVEFNKKQLLEKIRQTTSKTLRSEITYKNADISIWQNFPYIGIHLYDVYVEDSVYHQPFFQMQEVKGQVSLMQVFRKNVQLRGVSLKNGSIHLFTDTTGYTNKYLLQVKKQKDSSGKSDFSIDRASLTNVSIILENKQRNKLFNFLFHELDAALSTSGEVWNIDLETKALVKSMGFNLAKGSYLKDQVIQVAANLRYNKADAMLSFNNENFKIDEHSYVLSGNFMLRGDGHFDLSIKSKQAPYHKLQRLLPANIITKLNKIKLQKAIDVEASIKGPMAYKTVPHVQVSWNVKNNMLITEVAQLSGCSFTGTFNNQRVKGQPLTDENSEIVLKNFIGNWDGIRLSGKHISINNLVDPYIHLALTSATDLPTLDKKIGLESIDLISGAASLHLTYSGPLITDIGILDRMNGQLQFNGGTIRYIPRNFTFSNCSGTVFFSHNNVRVNDLKCTLGKNQFIVNAAGNNLSGLSAADASKATVSCNVYTPTLNIAELMNLFASKKAVVKTKARQSGIFNTVSTVDHVMDHGNLSVQLSAGTVLYKNFAGQNLKGTVIFSNNDLLLRNMSVNHANGRMDVSADIKQTANSNSASAKVQLHNVDVKKVFHAFNNFGQDGIEAHNMQGTLNTIAQVALIFDNTGNMVPGALKGSVDFSLRNGALVNYEPLMEIKKSIFKNKDMSHVTFAELKNKLEIDGFKVKINKMEVQSSAIGMFVDGLYDIKKEDTKINIQVPLKGLKQRDSTYIPHNIGIDTKAGTSVYLEGKVDKKTGKVKFGLNTTKTIRKLF